MSIINQDNIALYPDQVLAALTRLEEILHRLGCDAQIEDAMRLVPGKRAVFRGTLEGEDTVFRLPLDDANRESSAEEWAELSRAWGHMNTGVLRVAEPRIFDPDTGLLALAHVSGTPLLAHMWQGDAPARPGYIVKAAQWLQAYMAPTIEGRGINRRPWRNWAMKAVERQPHPELAEIEERILQKMHQLSRKMGDPEWRVAVPHGDFHLNNLIINGETLTGIDTGGSSHAPIYKDMARALTHMARRGMLPSGRRKFGVDAGAFDDFVRVFKLSQTESETFLPYMITFETLIKVEHPKLSAERIAHTVNMTNALFQDLRQIA